MKKYNVVWLFIDGVRRYHSTPDQIEQGDDRSRLDFMDEFALDAVELKNVMTSAPSTFMSLSAMVSGMPSYYINRNFDDFIFDNGKIPSLTNELINNNYNPYCFLMHKDTREKLLNIFPMIDRKYWPTNLSHNMYWSNDNISEAVINILKVGVKEPSFFFVDYNCREDKEISNKVKNILNVFRSHGYTSDNTITILCSDHGYPDSSKDEGRPEFYIKNNLGHDLVLTDDNVMIPMFIQYPDCPKGKKIETIGKIKI